MKKCVLFCFTAILLFIADASPGWGQVNPTGDNPYVVWEYDWAFGLQLQLIRNCDFSSDESLLAVLSYDQYGSKHDAYITFIETNTGKIIDSIHVKDGFMWDIKFYNDSTVIVGYNDRLRFYNIHTEQIVREIDYIKKFNDVTPPRFSPRVINQIALTNDKKYLAISTNYEFVVFDLEKGTPLMEKAISDSAYSKDPLKNVYQSCRFINKTNTMIVANGFNLLEFDYKNDKLVKKYNLLVRPENWNLDVSDSEDLVTYADFGNVSPAIYILNLKKDKADGYSTGSRNVEKSYFLFNDKYLHLSRDYDTLTTQLYSIDEKRAFYCNIPKCIDILRSKKSNKFILFGNPYLSFIDGDLFITDVNNVEKTLETLLHPNPGTNAVIIDINLKVSDLYSLKISNITGNPVKQQALGYLESGNNHLTIQISDLIPDVYFLTLTNNKQTYNFKLVKE
jgi:hypothetical protein